MVWSFLAEIARGRSLAAILQDRPDFPSYDWCKLQLRSNPALRAQYDVAVEERGDFLAEIVSDCGCSDSRGPRFVAGRVHGFNSSACALTPAAGRQLVSARASGAVLGWTFQSPTPRSASPQPCKPLKRLLTAYNDEIDITPPPVPERGS